MDGGFIKERSNVVDSEVERCCVHQCDGVEASTALARFEIEEEVGLINGICKKTVDVCTDFNSIAYAYGIKYKSLKYLLGREESRARVVKCKLEKSERMGESSHSRKMEFSIARYKVLLVRRFISADEELIVNFFEKNSLFNTDTVRFFAAGVGLMSDDDGVAISLRGIFASV